MTLAIEQALELARHASGPPRQSCPLCGSSIKFRGDTLCVDCATDAVAKLGAFVVELPGAQMPCGFDEPWVEHDRVTLVIGNSECRLGPCAIDTDADDAIAIGTAFVRAGMQARAAHAARTADDEAGK